MMTTYLDALMLLCTPFVYFSVTRSNHWLKAKKTLFRPFFCLSGSEGFNNNVHKAGVHDKAMNAESITDIAMVMANCWYNLPTMPGINPTGTNTAARINAIATTGAD